MLLFYFTILIFLLFQDDSLLFQLFLSVEALTLKEKKLFLKVDTLWIWVDFLINIIICLGGFLQLIWHFIHNIEKRLDKLFLLNHETIFLQSSQHIETCINLLINISYILHSPHVSMLQLFTELRLLRFLTRLDLTHLMALVIILLTNL